MSKFIAKGGGYMPPPCFLVVLLAAFFIVTTCLAQPDTLWTAYYNDGDANWRETCERLIQTQDGGFLLGGRTSTPGANRQWYPAYYLVKTDADGVEEWTGVYDVSARHDRLGGIAQGSNSQYFIAGNYPGNPVNANILKIDVNSDSLWSIEIENSEFVNVIGTYDENILACGTIGAQLAKINEDGELIWQRTYDGGGDEIFLDVIQTQDSGFVAVGWVWAAVCLMLKTDADGEQEWLRTYNFSDSTELFLSVIEVPGGGYLAGGWFDADHSLLARFDSNGDTIWVKKDIPHFEEPVNDIVAAPGGGYVIVGGNVGGFNEYAVKRIDDLGEEVWQIDVEFDNESRFDEATSILALDDGGYLIGGNGRMRVNGGFSARLMRTEPDTVVLPFEFEALAENHDFGDSVVVDSVVTWELPVHNFGRRYVSIDSVALSGDTSAFTFELELPLYINPPDTAFILVCFSPDSSDDYNAQLTFFYGDSQSVEVSLSGRGMPVNSVPDVESLLPTQLTLEPAWPNPFNSTVQIPYNLPQPMHIRLAIYNLMGREVTTLVYGYQTAGAQSVVWQGFNSSGTPVGSGVYFIRLEAGSFVKINKATLIR